MDKPSFVYVTYIATTPEKLWTALTDGDFTARYWGGSRIQSTWAVGAPVTHARDGKVLDTGKVLVCEPPRRLSYTWRVDWVEEMRREGYSRVTFTLEPMGDVVKLTLVHDRFEPGSKVLAAVQGGWPMVLASLKSLLETDHALTMPMGAAKS